MARHLTALTARPRAARQPATSRIALGVGPRNPKPAADERLAMPLAQNRGGNWVGPDDGPPDPSEV